MDIHFAIGALLACPHILCLVEPYAERSWCDRVNRSQGMNGCPACFITPLVTFLLHVFMRLLDCLVCRPVQLHRSLWGQLLVQAEN